MAILDDLTSALNKGIGQTERMLEMGRIKSQLAQHEESRKALFLALGRTVNRINRDTNLGKPEIDELCARIHDVDVAAIALQARLTTLQQEGYTEDTCPSCGGTSPAGAAFCVTCGKPMGQKQESTFCGKCGAQVPADSRFCVGCGTSVEGSTPPTVYAQAEQPE